MSIRVLIADDQPLLRSGLRGIITTAADMTVVGEAGTGREAVDQAQRHRPDLVLMDVRMPDGDGIQATATVTRTTAARVVILTTFDLDDYVYAGLRAGASGFLLKDTGPAELLQALRIVAAGDAILAPSVTARLIRHYAGRTELPVADPDPTAAPLDELPPLTDREHEVLRLVGGGLSNAEIAGRLHISYSTAKTHVAHLLTKLSARDRIQLVILAHRHGIAAPAQP